MVEKMKPVLVIGHGLAGAILAQSLLMNGIMVQCMDAGVKYAASSVAAGLINPFIGPKLNKPEEYDECIEANLAFFQKWEIEVGEKLFHSENLLRVFTSEKQVSKWKGLSEYSAEALSFLGEEKLDNCGISGKWGAGRTQAYRLHIQRFIALSKERLISMNCWRNESEIDIKDKSVSAIIFAEGFNVIENPFFSWLPFAPAQGEILELRGPAFPSSSNGTWIIPGTGRNYLAGSTWKHSDLKSGPTLAGKKEIYRKLNYVPIEMFNEINHFSGIRSGTKDRNPILGKHPEHKNLFIFNGFGSRGSTTIVLNANRLINLLVRERELPLKVSLKRFTEYYKDT
jgi:glycine/D-amino acid oxidase-like deaminating enzyme